MIRECFVPRAGCLIVAADYPQLELFTLAQTCYTWLGYSALGDMLKAGVDPHTAFASKLAKCTYDEGMALKDSEDPVFYKKRQVAKAFDFGKPGGLGNAKLATLAASPAYRVVITEDEAREYSKEWFLTFPEMKEYFARINKILSGSETATIRLPFTGFVRGGAKYCALCNTPFQHLGAACAKRAMWLIARAEYVDTSSPLYGARTVAMVHDELLAECREEVCHEAGFELARLMAVGANEYLPDCPIPVSKIKPVAMRCWSKTAKQVFRDNRLVPWEGQVSA